GRRARGRPARGHRVGTGVNEVRRSAPVSQWRLALRDIAEGLRAHRVWMLLARMDIRQRYRRSIIGPFWITIAMVIWILALGPLYSRLLGVGADELIPYVAMGIIGWGLISGLILDGAAAFVSA